MTTMKTRKTESSAPPTLADVARKRARAHLETYRALLRRHADGQTLNDDDLTTVAESLEALGLPDWVWARDQEALQRHAVVQAKFKAAVDAEPANRDRAVELTSEIESLQTKLMAKREELRRAQTGANKSTTYAQSLSQLAVEHPHVLGDIDTAVTLRLDELNRRKREGVS
jgi:hypothetical protein